MKPILLHPIFSVDPKGRGYSGYLAEFPELMAQGISEDEVVKKLLSSLVDILEYRKEQSFFADPSKTKGSNIISLTPGMA